MNKNLLNLILLLTLIGSLFTITAQNSLGIINPDWPWYSEPGDIQEATLTIKPKGIYYEYGLYLTFAITYPEYFGENDSLETQLLFDLGENSIVHDSWLWFQDTILVADIMDEWTAGQIYEDIVGRNLDPSILFKREGYYELRVFPIMSNLPRKVKLTYMVPTNWTQKNVTAPLPTEILQTSYNPVEKLKVVVYPTEEWTSPQILELPELSFEEGFDTTFGNYLSAEVQQEDLQSNLTFALNSPMQDGLYFSSFTEEDEDFYQLALLPSEILTNETNKNVMLLFDYSSTNSSLSKTEIIDGAKTSLLNYLSDADSFNIAFSKLNIDRVSDEWLPADSATIIETFDDITESRLANYGNLPSLISNGINFINSKGGDGEILLIANTDDVVEPEPANQLIDDIVDAIEGDISFNIADFQSTNINYVYIGDQYYEGNQYFYLNISRMTGGNYFRARDGFSYNELLQKNFQGIGGFISTFDLYTSISSGFCYGRYNFNLTGSSTYLDVPVFQVGKYNGSGNFEVEINGIYEGNVFSKTFEISENTVDQSDSTLRKIWINKYINELETQGSSNNIISEIINASVNNRVLSHNTAFLCLEPSMGGQICYDCRDDGGGSTDVETDDSTDIKDTLSITAYPNPFNNQTKIQLNLPASITEKGISFKIFNILGQLVKTFDVDQSIKGKLELYWDGRNDYGQSVASGSYIFVAITPQKTHSVKLLLIK